MFNSKGFLLVEYLLYFLLLLFLVMIVFQFSSSMYQCLIISSQRCNKMIALCAAQDLLVRDLQSAPAEKTRWKKIAKSLLIWQGKKNDIGWMLDGEKLFRLEGTYSTSRGLWLKKIKSLVANNITQLTFDVHMHSVMNTSIVHNVSIAFEGNIGNTLYAISTSVRIRNGFLTV